MKVTQVNYRRTFNLGNYASEVVGVEIELDPTDSVEEALLEAKNLVEQFHNQNNPQPLVNGGQMKPAGVPSPPTPEPQYKTAIQLLKEKQEKEIDGYIEAIRMAENLKTLSLYEKRLNENNDPENPKHVQFKDEYEKKFYQLTRK